MAVKAKTDTKKDFIDKLKNDKSIDWERQNLSTTSLILDVLYLLGISIDAEKNKHFTGFDKFLKENGVSIGFIKTPLEGEVK